MKKVILFLIFFSLFFCSSQANPLVFSHSAGIKAIIHTTLDENTLFKKGPFSRKTHVLNDYDDDCDDYDCDDQHTSIEHKLFAPKAVCFNSYLLTVPFICKPFYNKVYHHDNFSRLPRFDYISLRVLRL